jgi:hypothetical protein
MDMSTVMDLGKVSEETKGPVGALEYPSDPTKGVPPA